MLFGPLTDTLTTWTTIELPLAARALPASRSEAATVLMKCILLKERRLALLNLLFKRNVIEKRLRRESKRKSRAAKESQLK